MTTNSRPSARLAALNLKASNNEAIANGDNDDDLMTIACHLNHDYSTDEAIAWLKGSDLFWFFNAGTLDIKVVGDRLFYLAASAESACATFRRQHPELMDGPSTDKAINDENFALCSADIMADMASSFWTEIRIGGWIEGAS